MADVLKLGMNFRAVLDNYMCGKIDPETAIKEVAQLCKKADGRRAMFGWTLFVSDCEWEDLEDVVAEAGGDVVYVR